MDTSLYPLLFRPVYKDYIWGGRNLATVLGRTLPAGRVAEIWEIAAHARGDSVVANGALSGTPLSVVLRWWGVDLVGRNCAWALARDKFPLLFKLLDANDRLSVQVHPNDAYAAAHEGDELGKTEMWHILHAAPGAAVILGLKRGVDPTALRAAIGEGRLEPLLHRLPVRAGDTVCVPAGTVHAILGGIIVAEIQQNSDTTYRVFDWNRSGPDGPRPLHVEKALEVIDFGVVEPGLATPRVVAGGDGVHYRELCRNEYFVTELVDLAAGASIERQLDGDSLEIWGTLTGTARIGGEMVAPAHFVLLPAGLGACAIKGENGEGVKLLRTYVAAAGEV